MATSKCKEKEKKLHQNGKLTILITKLIVPEGKIKLKKLNFDQQN